VVRVGHAPSLGAAFWSVNHRASGHETRAGRMRPTLVPGVDGALPAVDEIR
jgi:hypothetical protein